MDRELFGHLDRLAQRLRTFHFWSGMSIVWVAAALFIGVIYLISQATGRVPEGSLAVAATIGVLGSLLVTFASSRTARSVQQVANLVETRYPQLDSALMTAVEQQPDTITGRLGYLQREVVGQAVRHARSHNWPNIVTRGQLNGVRLVASVGLVATLLAAVALGQLDRNLLSSFPTTDLAGPNVVTPDTIFEAEIEPGDTEVERGAGLLVLARFASAMPTEATLTYTTADGNEHTLPMSRSLDDPLFGGRIPAVSDALTYRVEFGNQASATYSVEVFEYPLMLQTDAQIVFPSYTGQEDKFVPDVRRVSAVEGSKLTLLCRVNKPLATAKFSEQTDDGEQTITLQPDPSDALTYSTTITVDRSRELILHLTDSKGRANQHPPKLQITMIANLPPDIKLAAPTKDIEVSPIEEVDLTASAWDDFGLKRVGINYSIPGKVEQDVSLGDSFPSKERVELAHLLAFESLEAEPDQLLSWYFWAEDIGPDGQLRRTMSDMFFAEVRPFEQIFRQGQQPPQNSQQQQQQQQQGGQNAQQAEQLAELQKQIIAATWKIIRRETRDQPTPQFTSDTKLLIESQEGAMVQLEELQGNLQDVTSIEHAAQVRNSMEQAIEHLRLAEEGSSPAKLQQALAAEQAAYQGLLRLRAREHEVVQSSQSQQQSSQSQQSQNSRAQQQLQQLQLRDDENRYAQEQQAQSQQQQEAREDRQVLNRLRELAQRQEDLNERIQELQGVLEAAEDEQARAEAQRQLKRLREEQEQILRDTEELQQRMEQPENQERMAEQRQQLEQARENIQRSSEAIQQQMVTQAANEGTRAQRELNDLREEFQRQTSQEFEQDLRDMQNQAQELVEAEQELARQLEDLKADKPEESNSLRETDNQEDLGGQLAEQQQRLEQLLQRMRETVEQAEQSQPLLAEKLYESIRDTRTTKPSDALKETEMLLNRGFVDQAAQREQQAREGIEHLAEGIQQAADQVLGDETEMLRRALDELEQLNEDLEGELARNGQQPQQGQQQQGQQQQGQQQQGQQQQGQQQQGQQQQGQQQQGQQQQGQQQQGQQQQGQQQQGQQQQGQQQQGQQQQGQQQQGGPSSGPGTGALDRMLGGGNSNRDTSPFSGDDFVDWSDRLRDVEEIVNDPELRAEAARIRDEARELRREQIDTSAAPQWDIIQQKVARPLAQLQNRVAEELLRRTAEEARVPIDKDPVPVQYEDAVRRYYERLGSSE